MDEFYFILTKDLYPIHTGSAFVIIWPHYLTSYLERETPFSEPQDGQ